MNTNTNENNIVTVDSPAIITLDDLVIEFASNFSLGMKAILAAAETYVTALRKYPTKARDEFSRRFPTIRKDTWEIIEDIGSGKLPPQATMMAPGAVAKLRDAKLPRRMTMALVDVKVSVYNPATGKYNDIPFTHLSESQADIVLNPITHDIRTLEQQKRYVKKQIDAVKAKPRAKVREWVVMEDGVLVKKMTKLTIADITAIAKEVGIIE